MNITLLNMTRRNETTPKLFGNWSNQTKELQLKYVDLTDEDLTFEAGKENELIARLEQRLKKTRDEVINLLKACQKE